MTGHFATLILIYPGPGRKGSKLVRDGQTSLSLDSSSGGEPKAFPGQPRDVVLFWAVPLGSPPSGTCLEQLPREASGIDAPDPISKECPLTLSAACIRDLVRS
ncbi:hypothetical protein AMECASPLE_021429 [Ameca splendens]|uniref:Uncharacterized protein n=1 Tax=Ameca splendens TaxID=208324 RepID=A0ABV0ZNC9_9TELE